MAVKPMSAWRLIEKSFSWPGPGVPIVCPTCGVYVAPGAGRVFIFRNCPECVTWLEQSRPLELLRRERVRAAEWAKQSAEFAARVATWKARQSKREREREEAIFGAQLILVAAERKRGGPRGNIPPPGQ